MTLYLTFLLENSKVSFIVLPITIRETGALAQG